ncbi:hypothetical protein FRC10_002228 [Ceratobasidium sp. 414]|nr:hypothetical protein FRC10_002228 [Ceratobasidium sp. 414]
MNNTMVAPTPVKSEKPQEPNLAAVSVLLRTGQVTTPAIPPADEKGNSGGKPVPAQSAPKPKPRFVPASRWIRFQLWFNTYRKFFTFVVLFELAGMITAGLGHFPYARENTGGFVIGNILAGVVVRNELFGRLLYLIVNTCFAKPSQKVAVIRFDRGLQQGLLGRISRTAVLEYHAFGTISEGKDAKYHYMVCGVQGDFTRALVDDMPTHIWTREVKFAGVGNTSTLYRRGIRICTGTGIGAALSTCLQSDQWFLIWIGSDVLKTFGPTIAELIERGVGDRAILWDTKKLGRPKTMELLAENFYKWNAEVVMITSNWDGNQEMMQGCKERGIPAFGEIVLLHIPAGTLWDF